MIGNNGLTDNVLKEIELNLNAHELIKIQVAGDDRDARKLIYAEICEKSNAIPVHHIGKQLVVYRASATVKESAKIHIPKL
jgi:RNA-binding protein